MKEQIIAQAAEAIIIKNGNNIVKRRIKKGYRIPEIDEKLRKLRTRQEAKLLEKASELISVPKLIKVDEKTKEIEMQFIEGKKLSEFLDNLKNKFQVMEKAGQETAKLHNSDIIHGDLTTSNMILAENSDKNQLSHAEDNPKNKSCKSIKKSSKVQDNLTINSNFKVYIIDFGLGFISKRIEDKAVDLHLIKQALEAKHFREHTKLFESFLKGYKKEEKEADKIFEQLKKVEARGRYRKNAH